MSGHDHTLDEIEFGINRLWCECGVELEPDCDISRVSIAECHEAHRRAVTGEQAQP